MQKYSSGGSSVTTIADEDLPSQRRIRRLRLTLHPGDGSSGEDEAPNDKGNKKGERAVSSSQQEENIANGRRKWRNGYVDPLEQQHKGVTNGVSEMSPQRGRKRYGVVQREEADSLQEATAQEWSVDHLRDQMNYIREIRDSLEKVRERMYGQFGGMQQSMNKLTKDIKTANAQKQSLENEVKARTAAMDSFDQMNSSLISANIDLQKSLLEKCSERVEARDKIRSLCSSCHEAEEKLRQRDLELAAALAENRSLRLQVEASRDTNSQALQELQQKLQKQHEEQLQSEQKKHRAEVEALRAQIDEYVKRLEEAERNARIAEAKIAERDQRISELERLLDCMRQERLQLQQKLQDCEKQLRKLGNTDQVDGTPPKKTQLEGDASELRERIKHLNDMVFCQQRKVKGMIEEVETLRNKMVQKDLFITELLDKMALAESKNNELEGKLKTLESTQSIQRIAAAQKPKTRNIGVGCDIRPETPAGEATQSQAVKPNPLVRSRLESSLLKYSPVQYSGSPGCFHSAFMVETSKDEDMSSPWTDRQGYTGDLQSKSREELCEMLHRQEKLLSNKRFIQSLPDKGKKISDFAQRIHLALAHHDEEERRRHMLSSARTEFQSKYQQALSQRQPGIHTEAPKPLSDLTEEVSQGSSSTPKTANQQNIQLKAPLTDSNVSAMELNNPAVVSMVMVSNASVGSTLASDTTEENELVDALEKVSLAGGAVSPSSMSAAERGDGRGANPFCSKQKKPHYIDVLEKSERSEPIRKPKFKPCQLPQKSEGSPGDSSPGGAPQLSVDARRLRDRKHLDDITSARLPPLHHTPTQLLSLEESVSLQQEHNRKQKELEAKTAAQKLRERLGVRMTSYAPEVGQDTGYRESRDEGAQLSSDED
ncbi:hypothetical protein GJAV_G00251610 [Gymnothorax javanicus]|nr:hypothetical protein GJAV_G00251610 [Gymnothorax javanicus]